jgi:hypothetical protein
MSYRQKTGFTGRKLVLQVELVLPVTADVCIVRALINVHNFEIKLHGRKQFLRPADHAALSNASVARHIQILLFLYIVSQTYGEFKN